MSRRFEGRTVFITGGARGQGRSHAVHFAREGADVAVCDMCADVGSIGYKLADESDLAETVRLCEAEGARVLADKVDVRVWDEVDGFAKRAVETFGKLDVLVANAGIFAGRPILEMTSEEWGDMIATNLTGVWHAIKAVVPSMVEQHYGRVVIIGSSSSLIGYPNTAHYTAAKHGVLGMTKVLAMEHAANGVTANCICPTGVHTPMLDHEQHFALMSPDNPTREAALAVMQAMNAIPDPWLEPEEVSKLVLFLASDDARHITGAEMKIDMGLTAV